MLGHGTHSPGGDRDQLGIIGFDSRIMGDPDAFSTPAYLHGFPGLGSLLAKTDASDGERDGLWMGHPVAEEQDNPGWVAYQTQVVEGLMGREGYGRDGVPDILFLNYKTTDIVGHRYSMDSPEMGLVLRAQDEALGELVDYLDTNVDGYALVVTADHGHTPSPRSSGGWPIDQRELERDLDARFGITGSRGLALATSAVGPFLDRGLMAERGITADAVAGFLERYTIAENWSGGSLPPGYGSRADETIFQAVWPSARLPEIMSCAFGNSRIGR
jgi:hypothetical protein